MTVISLGLKTYQEEEADHQHLDHPIHPKYRNTKQLEVEVLTPLEEGL